MTPRPLPSVWIKSSKFSGGLNRGMPFDEALKPYENDPRVSASVTTFANEGHALQAMAQKYQ